MEKWERESDSVLGTPAQDPAPAESLLMMDAASLDELLRHAHFARGVARALVGDEHLVEDVVQETWLAAVRRPPRVLSAAWIGTVAANAARKLRRGDSRRVAREATVAVPQEEAAFWRPEQQAILREVVDAVLALDEPYRSTVLLRFYEGLPPREIAARHGVCVNTVNSRLQRAVALLRARIDARGGRGTSAGTLSVLAGRWPPPAPPPATGPLLTGAIMGAKVMAVTSCAALVVAGLLVWQWTGADAPPPAVTARTPSAVSARSPEVGAPRRRAAVAAADASADHEAEVAPVAAAESPPARTAAVVEGRVVAECGALPPRGFAYVAAETNGERRVLARVDLAVDGTFRLEVPASVVGDGLDADVGVFAQGFARNAETVRLRGGIRHVVLTLQRGGRIAGVVQTARGSMVPDLTMLLRPMSQVPRVITDREVDVDAWLAEPLSPATGWARATTDAAGQFVAEGLTPGASYVFLAESAEWMLRTEQPVADGAQGVRVVAVPARCAVVHVKSVATGEPVTCDVGLVFKRRTQKGTTSILRSFGTRHGEVELRWSADEEEKFAADSALGETPRPMEVEVSVQAEGFHGRTVSVADPGAATSVLDVELDPVVDASLGRLELEVVDSRGDPVDEELRATLYAPGRGSESPSTSRLSKNGPGRFVVSASPGTWRLVLAPEQMPLTDESFTRDVELIAGGSSSVRVVLPESGWLVFKSKGAPSEIVGASNARGSVSQALGLDGTTRFRLKAGAWKATIGAGASAKTREVTVNSFEETVIDIDE